MLRLFIISLLLVEPRSGYKTIVLGVWVCVSVCMCVYMCDICCVYGSRPYGDVGAAFWNTLRSVTFYVVMTAHAY